MPTDPAVNVYSVVDCNCQTPDPKREMNLSEGTSYLVRSNNLHAIAKARRKCTGGYRQYSLCFILRAKTRRRRLLVQKRDDVFWTSPSTQTSISLKPQVYSPLFLASNNRIALSAAPCKLMVDFTWDKKINRPRPLTHELKIPNSNFLSHSGASTAAPNPEIPTSKPSSSKTRMLWPYSDDGYAIRAPRTVNIEYFHQEKNN
jgi:hypothetical protein